MNAFLIFTFLALIDRSIELVPSCNPLSPCGCSKISTQSLLSRIIGGDLVEASSTWPWIASLRYENKHQCGASLISTHHVITAAHCVYGILTSRLSLNFGVRNISTTGQLFYVKKVFIHPEYDGNFFLNDLALLELSSEVDIVNSNLKPICLPNLIDINTDLMKYPPTGENLVAIGWGTTNPFIRKPSTLLRQVTLQAIALSAPACKNTINNDTVQFCAGAVEGGRDTCYGDSGGPLMIFHEDRWLLIGITSFGSHCGLADFTGIYTRVTRFDKYMRSIMNSQKKLFATGRRIQRKRIIQS